MSLRDQVFNESESHLVELLATPWSIQSMAFQARMLELVAFPPPGTPNPGIEVNSKPEQTVIHIEHPCWEKHQNDRV